MSADATLSTLTRYEALFELSGEINAATTLARVGELFSRRIKYLADVFSWRYFSLEPGDADATTGRQAMVIDGFRGKADVARVPVERLCGVEMSLWRRGRITVLTGDELEDAKAALPAQFKRADIGQIIACPRFGDDDLQSVLLFSTRRRPFNELDVKFLTLASQFFHDKVHLLWEQQKLRDLEVAYLQQEIMLRQNEKLATLGRLTAGMAHELNNPAAAARRSADQLRSAVDQLGRAQLALGAARLGPSEAADLARLAASLGSAERPPDQDPLARSDLESELEEWLEARGVDEPWALAETLASLGWPPRKLDDVTGSFEASQLPVILSSLESGYTTGALVEEIREATGRISDLVNALRSYAYLDQGPVQRVDLHDGLNSTLAVLGSRLEDGVSLRREYDSELPEIEAFGRELNQVWTNLIGNALDAMDGSGDLVLRTFRDGPWAVVEIADTGPGIPEDIQARIFDPFFTTKAPGEGAGLGLSISHSIVVQKHHGRIDVRSRPGETCFQVRLPLEPLGAVHNE